MTKVKRTILPYQAPGLAQYTLPDDGNGGYIRHCPDPNCPAHERYFAPYWRLNEHMKTDHGWPRKSLQTNLDRRKNGRMKHPRSKKDPASLIRAGPEPVPELDDLPSKSREYRLSRKGRKSGTLDVEAELALEGEAVDTAVADPERAEAPGAELDPEAGHGLPAGHESDHGHGSTSSVAPRPYPQSTPAINQSESMPPPKKRRRTTKTEDGSEAGAPSPPPKVRRASKTSCEKPWRITLSTSAPKSSATHSSAQTADPGALDELDPAAAGQSIASIPHQTLRGPDTTSPKAPRRTSAMIRTASELAAAAMSQLPPELPSPPPPRTPTTDLPDLEMRAVAEDFIRQLIPPGSLIDQNTPYVLRRILMLLEDDHIRVNCVVPTWAAEDIALLYGTMARHFALKHEAREQPVEPPGISRHASSSANGGPPLETFKTAKPRKTASTTTLANGKAKKGGSVPKGLANLLNPSTESSTSPEDGVGTKKIKLNLGKTT